MITRFKDHSVEVASDSVGSESNEAVGGSDSTVRAERVPVLLFVAADCIGAAAVIRERTSSDAAALAPD